MLKEISIKNFAIIEKLQVTFKYGMTALTGETGAGKSIIIDAVGLLAGSRSSSDYIRQGADKCLLEGIFDVPKQNDFLVLAEDLGLELEEEVLIVQRDISTSGKNVCRVNGRTLTLANLKRIGRFLVDIQGQNDHQELMNPEYHISLLDSFAEKDFQALLTDYQTTFTDYRTLNTKVKKLQQNEQSFVQRIDMLTFQKEEIAAANLVEDEEEKLQEEREKLMNYQKIVTSLGEAFGILSGEQQSAVDTVGSANQAIESIAHLDPEYQQVSENIQSAYYLLQDAASDLSRQLDSLELDANRLTEVNERLEVIRILKRKYGETISEILAYYDKISLELSENDFSEGQLEKLEQRLTELAEKAQAKALLVHNKRQEIAHNLEQSIQRELKDLYMEHTQFEARIVRNTKHLTTMGFDSVEFFITTNPGEPLKPLVKVASGGELSRVMLALKTIFSQKQSLTSIVFDEVDTGVSGRVAQAIADKIYQIGRSSQVLCITHLPQVAAVADQQLLIEKTATATKTTTNVRPLKANERELEIARMLAGVEITELSLEHARELLSLAKKKT